MSPTGSGLPCLPRTSTASSATSISPTWKSTRSVFDGDQVFLLDLVAKVDDTAGFLMEKHWGPLYFPTPFGMKAPGPEENRIKAMDEKSGASLKLTILKPQGRVWMLVAGGGASVVYADTITDLIGAHELANYGEYSGNPSTQETRVYTETLLDLMTRTSRS